MYNFYRTMENIIKQIVKLNSKDYLEFLNKRIKSFTKVEYFKPSCNEHKTVVTTKFFGKDSKIVSGYAPLVLDDDSAYFLLFDKIKQLSSNYNLDNPLDVDKLSVLAVQTSVFEYFGNGAPNDVVRTLLYRNSFMKDEDLSISKFKGSNQSMCTERSALAQNYFKLLGYDCSYLSGIVFLNGQKDLHAFNVVRFSDATKIFDLVCTPINSTTKNLPSPIMCNLNYDLSLKALTDGEMDNLDVPYINFQSQSGKYHCISYGNLDKFQMADE